MENASKALLMAAGILISMMVISLAVYLFLTFGALSKDVNKRNEDNQLAQFNSQFTIYSDTQEGVTIYDIITMANLAKENNANYGLTSADASESTFYIKIFFRATNKTYTNLENENQNTYNNLIKEHSTLGTSTAEGYSQKTYKCQVDISNITGRVYKITIN